MSKQSIPLADFVSHSNNPEPKALGDDWRARTAKYATTLALLAYLSACCNDDDGARQFRQGAYESSFKTFTRRADKDDVAAFNLLGIHYYLGLGVARDYSAAARWFERGARAGNADAQRNLGVLYLRGWGVRRNDEMAYGWLLEAVNQGNRSAQKYLATLEITPNQTMRAKQKVAKQLRQPD